MLDACQSRGWGGLGYYSPIKEHLGALIAGEAQDSTRGQVQMGTDWIVANLQLPAENNSQGIGSLYPGGHACGCGWALVLQVWWGPATQSLLKGYQCFPTSTVQCHSVQPGTWNKTMVKGD